MHVIARLAALVPRPRVNLTRYQGLFAPRARHRQQVVATARAAATPKARHDEPGPAPPASRPRASMTWRQRLKPVFAIDLSACPWCGAPLRVIAGITEPTEIARILEHIAAREAGEDTARGPPLPDSAFH